jgi:pimeloyl-ACP methyl ester carboxylesterase
VKDIDGVLDYLKKLGYERFFLMGLSTGSNKICVYHQILKQQGRISPFAGYILLSGGDDVGLWYEDMGTELFHKVLLNADKTLQENRGEERPTARRCFLEDFSYQSAYDILNPDGLYNCFPFFEAFRERIGTKVLFQEFSQLDIPALVIYGESDEYVRFPITDVIETLRSHNASATYEVLPGANHSFDGDEKILSERILSWMKNEKLV